MALDHRFETFGNASLQVFVDGEPWLVTDPWLEGHAYFGSWGLYRPPDPREIAHAQASAYVWVSHGHPDHLHLPSIARLKAGQQHVLLPGHYVDDVPRYFREAGFEVTVLPYRDWVDLGGGVRVQCLQHANQDAILLVELGRTLVVNCNDCPLFGEIPYLRKLIRRYERSYFMALCAVEADMVNIVDAEGQRTLLPPDDLKPRVIWGAVDLCRELGVDAFCCSSSQHVYCREDSSWANAYLMHQADMERWWSGGEDVALIPAYSSVSVATGAVEALYGDVASVPIPTPVQPPADDWGEPLQPVDAQRLDTFFKRLELLPSGVDFVRFTVGGVRHEVALDRLRRRRRKRRGVHFHVPRGSLMETVEHGYFDDLLIGNFMRTELINLDSLYPHFTPIVSKLGGVCGVFTADQRRRFRWHYFRMSPWPSVRDACKGLWLSKGKPVLRLAFTRLGLLEFFKRFGRRLRGLPPLPRN